MFGRGKYLEEKENEENIFGGEEKLRKKRRKIGAIYISHFQSPSLKTLLQWKLLFATEDSTNFGHTFLKRWLVSIL